MAKKQGGRLLSSAGLVNYYEKHNNCGELNISPITVMVVAAVIGIIVMVFRSSLFNACIKSVLSLRNPE